MCVHERRDIDARNLLVQTVSEFNRKQNLDRASASLKRESFTNGSRTVRQGARSCVFNRINGHRIKCPWVSGVNSPGICTVHIQRDFWTLHSTQYLCSSGTLRSRPYCTLLLHCCPLYSVFYSFTSLDRLFYRQKVQSVRKSGDISDILDILEAVWGGGFFQNPSKPIHIDEKSRGRQRQC